ncbi:archaeal ATPase [Enterobacter cloacae]|uniref:Archaeal ATPase n=2 Tax=Enterobacter sichuanensis TaxID=2071710 RepID=A0ABS6GH33_9ENTR|nr:archaeal ATPase [Enterobacter sichuanensis]OZV02233.1 archaeal ATPase [Enterobacter cloacae]PAO16261.1 archaeal ATPase [Enterobacter cloacae]
MTDSIQTETTEGKIIINLFAPNLPGSTKEDDLIQKSLRDQLVESIRNSVTLPDTDKSAGLTRFIDESGRNVFFVDGTRGAGKTTFINSVVKSLNNDQSDVKVSIKCLPTIDPTKLPRHEPILVTVTARLNKMVSDKLKGCWASNDYKKQKEQWQNHLAQLQRGLHLLTDKEYKPEYFSDALKLDAQLDYSIGGQDLSEIFEELVKRACEILGCKAILITFDDIDTQFDAGWDVLESIRKFFNSRKLVVVATGDLRLYSQLIRGKQYENYSKTLLDQEKESARLAERGYMVEHLEQQYLLKIFPVQKRIQLKTMLQLVGEKGKVGKEKIKVKTEPGMQDNDAIDVRQAIGDAVREGLNLREGSDADMYVNELLKQPVRLLMQVLQDFYTKKYHATSVKPSGKQSRNERPDELSVPNLLRNALYGSMLSSIYRAGLNYEQHRFGMDSLCKDIFTYVKQDRDFNTGFYLRPQSESEALRNCSIYLASQVSENCQGSLSKFLQMLLVGCGSVSIFNQFVTKLAQAEKDREKFEQLVSEYVAYMSVGRIESASHWANRCCAVVANNPNDENIGVFLGMVQLNRKSRQNMPEGYKKFNIDTESGLAKAAMAASLSTVASSNLMDFSSVFNLIGAIADISACRRERPAITNAFNKVIAQTTCIVPPWSEAAARAEMKVSSKSADNDVTVLDVDLDPKDDGVTDESQQDDATEFSDAITKVEQWLKKVNKIEIEIRPSALLIGKVWSRFYFNLNNVADQHKTRLFNDAEYGRMASQSNAAKIMRFNVLAFLHAVLVEESLYHSVSDREYLGEGLRLNPVTSVDTFEKKIKVISEELKTSKKTWKDTHPLFFLLISCPILHPFIFPVGGVNCSAKALSKEVSFNELIGEIVGEKLLSDAEWDYLSKNGNQEINFKQQMSQNTITSLNSSTIVGASYDKPTPARKTKSPSLSDGEEK